LEVRKPGEIKCSGEVMFLDSDTHYQLLSKEGKVQERRERRPKWLRNLKMFCKP
jgi:hypothetical protein